MASLEAGRSRATFPLEAWGSGAYSPEPGFSSFPVEKPWGWEKSRPPCRSPWAPSLGTHPVDVLEALAQVRLHSCGVLCLGQDLQELIIRQEVESARRNWGDVTPCLQSSHTPTSWTGSNGGGAVPGQAHLGKALRLVSKYSLRPFCTMSSSLLQSRRLSSNLWSEHTLITYTIQSQGETRSEHGPTER